MEVIAAAATAASSPIEPFLPYIAPVVVALIAGCIAIWTSRRSTRVEEAKTRAQSQTSQFDQAIELDKYTQARIDAAVAKAIEPWVKRVERLERGYAQLATTLRSVRQAFREYIRAVRAQWGRAVEPPAVDAHIRELLAEDDLDGTFDERGIAQMRADYHQPDADPAHD
ncbi:hypothetical protein KK103_12000 [Curtobacterium flaccumfaciens pv. flaccumfaciens]|uniref:Uncharacterized protein n=1 Tax=Curtobacterium flaccumfaciens pv. flaccumfaciens TaxID=138532 RepID=A0A9Q2W5Y9_9MICO|nr:hypothetical protein [Curtobacterium flaccumfaciens]MBT1542488.1 hypothetical protein [Curtobacterium flaccumfaciens pv. flaccumfaciens]